MATEKVDILQVDTAQSQTSVKDLRKEMKGLKNELLNLEEGTQEYNAALQKAAGIQHTLKEQMEEVNASAMDAGQILGNTSNAIAGMTGAFQAGAGVLNMFGVESEASMKAIQQMQNVMAITQGFSAIDDGLKAFKRLGIVIKGTTLFQKLFNRSKQEEVATVAASTTGNVANAAAQNGVTVATKGATAATHGFKKALIATGIGAIVVLIGTLIANWDKFAALFKSDAAEQQEIAAKQVKGAIADQQHHIDILKARGAGAKELYAEEYKLYQLKLKQAKAELALLDKGTEEYDEKLQQIKDLNNAQQVANEEYKTGEQEKIDDAKKKRDEDAANQLKKAQETAAKLKEQKAAAAKKQREDDLKAIDKIQEETAAKTRTESQQALFELTTKYNTELALLIKYGEDTTLLTSQFEAGKTKIINDEALKQEQLIAETNQKKSDALLASYEQQEADMNLGEKKLLAARLEALAKGEMTQQQFDDANLLDKQNRINDEIEMLQSQLDNEQLIGDARKKIEEELADKKIELNQKVVDDKKAKTEEEKEIEAQKLDNAVKIAGAMSSLIGAAADLAKEGSSEQKALQISSSIIDTIGGAISAYTSAQSIKPAPVGMVIGAINAATVLATGFANIKKMKQVPVGNGGSGGPSIPSVSLSGLAASQAPVQATTQITGASTESQMKDTRVYVVESDIKNVSRKVSVAENEARF